LSEAFAPVTRLLELMIRSLQVLTLRSQFNHHDVRSNYLNYWYLGQAYFRGRKKKQLDKESFL